ncbi:MAG: redox-sensing transcriptional repressor Rex [Phycisphaerae bacterium]|nr:redox-sensing transcriptional repressor Rex [Phycisphaerae bacterium]
MITNKKCIIRLSRYKNALKRLKALGFVKVFSDNLSDAAGATPSQVRKDFSMFGISGYGRGGYNVDELIEKLRDILGKNEIQNVVIVGTGHIGRALLKYKGFGAGGIQIIAGFDIDPAKYDANSEIPIYPLDDFRDYVMKNAVKIGILAVPDYVAQQVSEIMISAGIKGILNFAPIQLRLAEDVVINNINLEIELENLIYFVNVAEKTGGKK